MKNFQNHQNTKYYFFFNTGSEFKNDPPNQNHTHTDTHTFSVIVKIVMDLIHFDTHNPNYKTITNWLHPTLSLCSEVCLVGVMCIAPFNWVSGAVSVVNKQGVWINLCHIFIFLCHPSVTLPLPSRLLLQNVSFKISYFQIKPELLCNFPWFYVCGISG